MIKFINYSIYGNRGFTSGSDAERGSATKVALSESKRRRLTIANRPPGNRSSVGAQELAAHDSSRRA